VRKEVRSEWNEWSWDRKSEEEKGEGEGRNRRMDGRREGMEEVINTIKITNATTSTHPHS
jgi:hypothetical protein